MNQCHRCVQCLPAETFALILFIYHQPPQTVVFLYQFTFFLVADGAFADHDKTDKRFIIINCQRQRIAALVSCCIGFRQTLYVFCNKILLFFKRFQCANFPYVCICNFFKVNHSQIYPIATPVSIKLCQKSKLHGFIKRLNRTALAFIIIRHFGQFLLIVTVMQSDSTHRCPPLHSLWRCSRWSKYSPP